MTKENREKAYLHFRDLERNYVASEQKNRGLTSTSRVREHAKKLADKLLKRNPELTHLGEKKAEAPEKESPKKEEPKKEAPPRADSKKKEKK